jgi:hypothetical protein
VSASVNRETVGRAQKTLTIEDHTGGLVTVVP